MAISKDAQSKQDETALKWLPVILTDRQWGQAIGDGDGHSHWTYRGSELSVCCGQVADMRNLLIRCRGAKGLHLIDRDQLQLLIDAHGHPGGATLRLLGAQLGIEWKER